MVKRVLVANKYHFISGGAERYFLSFMEALRAKGIEAIPLSLNYKRTTPNPYQKYFISPVVNNDEAKIQNQNPTFLQQIRLARQVIYNDRVKASVQRIHRDLKPEVAYLLNINNHLSPSVIDACAGLGIPIVMRMSDFNLVCASNMYYRDGHPCTDCKKGLHHAIIHRCVHGSFLKSCVGVFANSFHRWVGVYKKVDAFITPTEFMKKDLYELGIPENKIYQVNTFVKPNRVQPSDQEIPYILYVGRFAEYKGAGLAMEAFSRIADSVRARFYLVGDENDEDSKRVREIARRLNQPKIVILPFEQNKQKLVELIQKSLFTVVPSQFYENLPNTILESFSCGRPVVATRIGSIPEVIRDGENGLLFEFGNAEDLSSKMEHLLRDDTLRQQMGESAYRSVINDYSEESHLRKVLEVFNRVAEEACSRSR